MVAHAVHVEAGAAREEQAATGAAGHASVREQAVEIDDPRIHRRARLAPSGSDPAPGRAGPPSSAGPVEAVASARHLYELVGPTRRRRAVALGRLARRPAETAAGRRPAAEEGSSRPRGAARRERDGSPSTRRSGGTRRPGATGRAPRRTRPGRADGSSARPERRWASPRCIPKRPAHEVDADGRAPPATRTAAAPERQATGSGVRARASSTISRRRDPQARASGARIRR